jgi:hypothetical protein
MKNEIGNFVVIRRRATAWGTITDADPKVSQHPPTKLGSGGLQPNLIGKCAGARLCAIPLCDHLLAHAVNDARSAVLWRTFSSKQ